MPNRLDRRLSFGALLAVIGALCVPAGASASVTLPGQNSWNVHTKVVSANAGHVLAYGLSSPQSITVCSDCAGGETANFGAFAGGTELTAFLTDSSCAATFQSSGNHARVTQLAPLDRRPRNVTISYR